VVRTLCHRRSIQTRTLKFLKPTFGNNNMMDARICENVDQLVSFS
jgi:hypothetical protein